MEVLVIDRREMASPVPGILRTTLEVDCREGTLWYGDYACGGVLGVERKSAADFARSVIDGRLFRQMSGLKRNYERPLLIVEGLRHGVMTFGVGWRQLRGALLCVSIRFQVPVMHSSCAWETAEFIVAAARFTRAEQAPVRRAGWRPRRPEDRAMYVLQGLPGVGSQRAAALLRAFGSLDGVLRADDEALLNVEGVGRATVAAIRAALTARWAQR